MLWSGWCVGGLWWIESGKLLKIHDFVRWRWSKFSICSGAQEWCIILNQAILVMLTSDTKSSLPMHRKFLKKVFNTRLKNSLSSKIFKVSPDKDNCNILKYQARCIETEYCSTENNKRRTFYSFVSNIFDAYIDKYMYIHVCD